MIRTWQRACMLCACMLVLGLCPDAQADSRYAEGNRAYMAARYTEAISRYRELIAAGVVHEHLYYNLGNAYFRAGDLGRAVYNYERALGLAPGFDDARHNLTVARQSIAEMSGTPYIEPAQPSLWQRSIGSLSLAWLIPAFIIANMAFFAGLIMLHLMNSRARRGPVRVMSGLAGAVLLIVAILLAGRAVYLDHADLGIVLPAEVELREGADPNSTER